jgi:arylsulfatase A-like enzyme
MNIVLICCDALRGDVGKAAGMPYDVCPTVDRLGQAGTRFRHAYCTMPLCVPSRVTMLTGRWPDAHRVRMNLDPKDAVFSMDIYQVANDAGYTTGLCGKNHTYLKAEDVDYWREFGHEGAIGDRDSDDEVQSFESWLKRLNMGIAEEPTPYPLETQISYRIVSDAIEFLQHAGQKPFFLQVSFPEPHGPIQVPEPYWNMFDPATFSEPRPGLEVLPRLGYRMQWLSRLQEDGTPGSQRDWRRYLSNYFGAIRMVDDQIARLIQSFEQLHLRQQTLIVFVADHGDYLMQYGVGRKGVGLPEALVHIPMVFSGGDLPPSAADDRTFVSMADVMPTLCEAIGAPVPQGVQGRSLWPILHQHQTSQADRTHGFDSIYVSAGLGGLYYDAADNPPVTVGEAKGNPRLWDTLNKVTQSGNQKMVRMGEWKLIYDMMGYGQLYNLAADPAELNNLFGSVAAKEMETRLMQEMAQWTMRLESPLTTASLNRRN